MKKIVKVAVHNGVFHADECMAVAILSLAGFAPSIERTRNPKVIESCQFVIDVGNVYDPANNAFDHHQWSNADWNNGVGCRQNGIPYASAGLVWKHFGLEICQDATTVWASVDETLVQTIDRLDTGYDDSVDLFTISSIVNQMNPTWDSKESHDGKFTEAVEFCKKVLQNSIDRAMSASAAIKVVNDANLIKNGQIMILDKFCPYEKIIFDQGFDDVKFVVYPSLNNDFCIKCVPDALGSFGQRKSLPQEWGGLRDKDLDKVTEIPDCVFCHGGLFIAGHKTQLGAINMAVKAC